MMVKIHADDEWQPAEQLELFSSKELQPGTQNFNKNIQKCCGTCRFWIVEPQKSFTERLKERFKAIPDPYCRHNNKPRNKEEGSDCLGYKIAYLQYLEQRG